MAEALNFSENDKLKQIETWLSQTFGSEKMPSFEMNRQTINILFGLMTKNQMRNKDVQIVIDDLQEKSIEYSAEAQRLNAILSKLNLTSSTLFQSGHKSVHTLADVSLQLNAKDATQVSLLTCLDDLQDKEEEFLEKRLTEKEANAQLNLKVKAITQENTALHRALESLAERRVVQDASMFQQMSKMKFFQTKLKEYKSNLDKKKNQLTAVGCDPSLHHETLIKQSQELKSLRQKIEPLKSKLKSYTDLPPSIPESRLKIEELKLELVELEEQILKKVESLHL